MNLKPLFFVFLILCVISSYGQKLNLTQIIDKVGKQRILCEQITKSFLMVGSAVKTEDSKTEFDDAKFAFSKNLLFLNENSKLVESKIAIQNVTNLWNDFKILIETKPTKENALNVIDQSNLILKSCNEMVSKIYNENNLKSTRLINLCNKQRLNTQKIAKFCVLKNWKINYLDLEKDLNEALTSYEFTLSQMLVATENTSEINNILLQQESDWSKYKSNFIFENKSVVSEKIQENTNILLNEFNKLATLYQKIAISNIGVVGN